MNRTLNPDVVNELLRRVFNAPALDVSAAVADSRNFVLIAPSGVMAFWHTDRPGLYTVVLGVTPDSKGDETKQMIRDGFEWMFINSDALVVRGTVDKANAACRALVVHTLGGKLEDELFTITAAAWARARGPGSEALIADPVKASKLARALGKS